MAQARKISPQEASKSVGYGYSSILTQLLGALDQPVYNTDGYREFYKQMLTEDETISAGLEYLTGRVVARIGSYSHPNPEIKELVDRCVESLRGTMTNVRRNILRDSFVYGYGVSEFTVKAENGHWVLSSMSVYDPTTIQFKLTQYKDKSYGIGAVVQRSPTGGDIDIPVNKCLVKTYGSEYTPYGQSILRRCYRWWSFKKAIPKLWAVALERFGMPLLVAQASSKGVKDELEDALANANSRAYIVTDKESTIHALASGSSAMGSGYEMADAVCDKKIFRAMFLPALLGAGDGGGSYALGNVHMEMFNSHAQTLAEDYIDAELEQLWRPIIEWNFGPQEDYGTFDLTDTMDTSEKQALSSMLATLSQVGVIDPESDRKWIRESLKLPEADDGEFPQWGLMTQQAQAEQAQLGTEMARVQLKQAKQDLKRGNFQLQMEQEQKAQQDAMQVMQPNQPDMNTLQPNQLINRG